FKPCVSDNPHAEQEKCSEDRDCRYCRGARQSDGLQCAEQQKAEHDHEARIEEECFLEGPWCCEEQQHRQSKRCAAAEGDAATTRGKTGDQETTNEAAGGNVQRQHIVREREDQFSRFVEW